MAHRGERFNGPLGPVENVEDGADFVVTPELAAFADVVWQRLGQDLRAGSAALESPLQAVFAALHGYYQNDMQELLRRAQKQVGENTRLSEALATVCARRKWCVATARKYATTIKRILALLQLPPGFVDSLRIIQLRKAEARNKALGKYANLPADDPARKRVEAWVATLRDGTRNTSELSLRNIIGFYCNTCLPALGLDLRCWPEDAASFWRQG